MVKMFIRLTQNRQQTLFVDTVHGKPLVYFDTAASAQRPSAVIDATSRFYSEFNANVHRGVHTLSQEATDLYEDGRRKVAAYINAPSEREVIFTRGTTEAINLVANSFLRPKLGPGDEILITHMEHHSNIVPWQMLCEEIGARLHLTEGTVKNYVSAIIAKLQANDRTHAVITALRHGLVDLGS